MMAKGTYAILLLATKDLQASQHDDTTSPIPAARDHLAQLHRREVARLVVEPGLAAASIPTYVVRTDGSPSAVRVPAR